MSVGTLKIVYRDPRSLKGYPRNSRLHTQEQILAIGRSIREFGFVNPVLLKDDNTTIGAGHARVLAAIAEGLDKVPTVSLKGLSDAQWRAYIIADNRLAENGSSWDKDALKIEFGDLKTLGFDLTISGFDAPSLVQFFANPIAPNEFPSIGEDIETEHECPRCRYRWSGKSAAE